MSLKVKYLTLIISIIIAQNLKVRGSENDSIPTSPSDTVVFDELVVVGMRYRDKMFETPQSVSVLTNSAIQNISKASMAEVLESTPGIFMQRTNNGGGSPFVRGLTGYHTLIMIDGIRLNNPTFRSGPNQYANTIDAMQVERIEVLKGGGSVQYGSDAIGGTIYILSKSPDFLSQGRQIHGFAKTKLISDNMEQSGRVELESLGEKFSVSGGISYKNYGNIKAGGDLGVLKYTAFSESNADLKANLKINNKTSVGIVWQNVSQMDVPLYHKLIDSSHSVYSFDPQKRDLVYVRLKSLPGKKAFSEITATASFHKSLEIRKKQKRNSSVFTKERDLVNSYGLILENVSDLTHFWKLSTGMEFYFDMVESNSVNADKSTGIVTEKRGLYPNNSISSSTSVFTLNRFTIEKAQFEAGIRYNSFSLQLEDDIFESTSLNPSALVGMMGLSYALSRDLRLVASVNSAFRAPNINDVSSLGIADFRYEVPNPDLKPEKSLNTEIGIKHRSNKTYFSIFAYRNNLRDLITDVPTSFNGHDSIDGIKVYHKQNADKALLQGIEAEFQYDVAKFMNISSQIVYTHGQNITDNEPMRRIPPLYAGLSGVFYPWKNGMIRIDCDFAGSQKRLSSGDKSDNRIAVGGTPGWSTFGLSFQQNWNPLYLQCGVNNIFNEEYRTHGSGIDGAGRSFWVSVSFHF
jgi:outer membrane receptor protein involved in Fe transport